MEALSRALAARSEEEFGVRWKDAAQELASTFSAPTWGINGRAEPYSDANRSSLWRNELSEPVRVALEAGNVGESEYGEWLGEIHYVYVAAYLESLFDSYKGNQGWRVLAISFPALGTAAIGIASHYQQAQNHNRLGEVSNLLYDHAQSELGKMEVPWPGRKVEPADWDGAGLVPAAKANTIAGVALPPELAVRLKYVRTTTVKKILASFINIQPIDLGATDAGQALGKQMSQLEKAARALV